MSRVAVKDEQIKAAQAGNSDAMWEIVQAFDGMLNSMIRSVAPGVSAVDAEDYLQEARAVLIQHVRDYDSSASSAALSSFVFQAARRRIAEEHLTSTTALTVDPTTALRVKRALWHADGDIEKAWRTLSDCRSEKNRMERERFMAVVEALAGTENLDQPVSGNRGSEISRLTLADVIADPASEITGTVERRDYARWLMAQISARQAFALRAFYGVQMTAMTDAEASADLQVRPAALRRLRSDGMASARRVAAVHARLSTYDGSLADAA